MCRKWDVLEDSSTQAAFKRAARWLSHCVNLHQSCKPHDPSFVPRRLLNVGHRNQRGYPRLFEPNEPVRYACLSYCWGDDVTDILTTTKYNLEDHCRGIHPNSMPKSVSDAVRVCRGLDIQYLWVDSLCIVQDDREAWHRDASMMDLIYLNSHVTIAALEPKSCKTGFLGKQKFGLPGWQYCSKLRDTSMEVVIRPIADRTTENSLDRRAWCLQETLLPNRRLCFDGNEMIWECSNYKTCECGHHVWPTNTSSGKGQSELDFGELGLLIRGLIAQPAQIQIEERAFHIASEIIFHTASRPKSEYSKWLVGIKPTSSTPDHRDSQDRLFRLNRLDDVKSPDPLDLLHLTTLEYNRLIGPTEKRENRIYEVWRNVVIRYSLRSLSRPTDKLLAVAGLANIIHGKTRSENDARDEYLAGLWKKQIHFDLSWQVTTYEGKPKSLAGREHEYYFPSWSWASCSQAITYDFALTPWNWKCETKAVDKCRFRKVEGISDDRTATTRGAFIRLEGILTPVELALLQAVNSTEDALRDSVSFSYGASEAELKTLVRSRDLRTVPVTLDRLSGPRLSPADARAPCWIKGVCQCNYCSWYQNHVHKKTEYYCFRLFSWIAINTKLGIEPETWFLVLKQSSQVEGAFERVGAGVGGNHLFEAAQKEIINIV